MPRVYGHGCRPHPVVVCHPQPHYHRRPHVSFWPNFWTPRPRPIIYSAPITYSSSSPVIVAPRRIIPVAPVGVTALVAGIALMILGGCLLPVTLGGSIALMVCGGLVTAGGIAGLAYSKRMNL